MIVHVFIEITLISINHQELILDKSRLLFDWLKLIKNGNGNLLRQIGFTSK